MKSLWMPVQIGPVAAAIALNSLVMVTLPAVAQTQQPGGAKRYLSSSPVPSRLIPSKSDTLDLVAQARPLPRLVDRAVRRDAASRSTVQIAPEQLQIVEYKADIWPNGCLGLGKVGETCTQSLVSGWRVIITDDIQTWTYRTNASGQNTRLEPPAIAPTSSQPFNPRPVGGDFIGDPTTTSSPLPEELQLPSSQVSPLNGQVRITLINRTNATVTYQVIGDTTLRQLSGQKSVALRLIDIPATVTFRRDDGGLLMVRTRNQSQTQNLEVFLDAALDLSLDRTTLTIERNGEVFLN